MEKAWNALSKIPFIQINLHHCKSASAVLARSLAEMHTCIALIQEPWLHKGRIAGLGGCGQLYAASVERPRSGIIVKGLTAEFMPSFSGEDLTVVKLKLKFGGGERVLVLGSCYFPYDSVDPPPSMVRELVAECNRRGYELVLGCDANAHHCAWGSTNCNARGDDIMEYLLGTDLDLLNRGRVPTFRNAVREEVIDITLATMGVHSLVSNWRVSEEVSMSDHDYIRFDIEEIAWEVELHRNPKNTNWELYTVQLEKVIDGYSWDINDVSDLERCSIALEEKVIKAYESSCRLRRKGIQKGATWWNQHLGNLRKSTRKHFDKWKKTRSQDNLRAFKEAQREYKRELSKARRESWKKFCEEVDSIPCVAKLNRILSRGSKNHSLAVKLPSGKWAEDGVEALNCLLPVHFPGLGEVEHRDEMAEYEPFNSDNGLVAKLVDKSKLEWAVGSFEPFKTAGIDGIFPALLQKGLAILTEPLLRIFRACLLFGYVPQSWRRAKVIFLPKVGKLVHEVANDFRPISLTSFLLKTLERLVDCFIKEEALRVSPLHKAQHAYQVGKSVDSALLDAVNKIETGMKVNGMALGAFLDIEGAFNYATRDSICQGAREHNIPGIVIRWMDNVLKTRVVEAQWGSTVRRGLANRGCPQGGVLSPTMWALVVDDLLRRLNDLGIYAQAYADDVLVLVSAKDEGTLSGLMNNALGIVEGWCKGVGLSVNPRKTVLVNFTSRYKIKKLGPFSIFGEEVAISEKAKYLGVTLDRRLRWKQHLEDKKNKFIVGLWACKRALGPTWGLKPHMIKWLYTAVLRPRLLHGAIAWWPRCKLKTGAAALQGMQAMIVRCITGARKSSPVRALEMLVGLPPLDAFARAEAMKAAIRVTGKLGELRDTQLASKLGLADTLGAMDPIPRVLSFDKKYSVGISSREESETYCRSIKGGKAVWFTDGSKNEIGTGAAAWLQGSQVELVISLEDHTTVFQAEIKAIAECVEYMKKENWTGRDITICSDSRAALSALHKAEVKSREVKICQELLSSISSSNRVELRWTPGHSGVVGNEKADRLAKRGASGLRSARRSTAVPMCYIAGRIRNWLREESHARWRGASGCLQAKRLLGTQTPQAWSEELLLKSKGVMQLLCGWMTGHWEVRGHLRRIGRPISEDICRLCLEERETTAHLLCDCPCFMGLRRRVCGEFLLKGQLPGALSLPQVLNLIRGIEQALKRGG